ncbi:toxin glutamine deamidase domain-containing protein [Actinoallomurus acaciae]|uniref:Toxin glutamine deamidase domain-containing protein n=1 Tax=Actinoallomurus acaciae TaxID=502577 RepID=A0ABV5YUM6_9ACTN
MAGINRQSDGEIDASSIANEFREDDDPAEGEELFEDEAVGESREEELDEDKDFLRQRQLGEELANYADKKVDRQIDHALDKVNPKFDRSKSAYSENCTGVVQAYELRRRGHDVEAGPLEPHLRRDQDGVGGRQANAIEQPWGRNFTDGTKSEIEEAFREPGARGIVRIRWNTGGGHVFNVENVGGKVRFIDGQPTPAVTDASHYFNMGRNTKYLRLDDLPTPRPRAVRPYLEP